MASTQGTASGVRAGRAFVELFADDSRLVRGLRRAEKKLRAFGDRIRNFGMSITGLGAAIAAPLGILTIKAASDAQESLSRFEQVFRGQADAASAFADQLAKEVGRSKFAIRDALGTYQSFFLGLGLGPEKARGLSQSMQQLALDFASFNNLSDEEALARFISALSGSGEVLDRFGVNIRQAALEQELLRMGVRKSWNEVSEQEKMLARLNVIMRTMGDQGAIGDAVHTSDSFANQMKRLRGQLHDTAVVVGQALLPVVTPLVAKVAEMAGRVADWAQKNQKLIATAFEVLAGITAAGAALVALGVVISLLGTILGGLATVVTGVGAALGVMGTVLAALVSPIGLVIAAVAALGAYLLYTSGAGAKALEWLKARFTQLYEEASAAFRGISDALAAGDIGLAMRVLWLTLKLEWQKGVNFLKSAWLSFRGFFIDLAYQAFYGALSAFEIAWHGLEVAFIETTAFLSKAWTRFTAGFQKSWNTAINWTAKRLLELQGLFDSSLDVDAAKRLADQELKATNRRIDQERDRALAEGERQRQQRRDTAQQTHENTLGEIGRQYEEAKRQLDGEYDTQRQESEEALAKARREWEEALAEAANRRAQNESTSGGEALQSPDEFLKNFDLAALNDVIGDAVKRTIDVRGTFNAAAIQGLAASSDADERTAQATEETARNTKKIARDVRTSGMAFT